ncbi:MAG: hypothetical protein L6R37_006436 [Teloschistes peruensis]|nr:MAG: hypothetical protein L6R37_006436 [Teloschistes peruensis]
MPDSPHRLAARKNQPATAQDATELSFFRRKLWTIFLGLTFHSSIIVLTTMLVLIIQAATSKPRKYINRGYFIGLMLAFGACFTTTILIYVKYSERKRRKRKLQGLSMRLAALNEPELALHPRNPIQRDGIERIHTVINSWQHGNPPDRQDLRSIIGPRVQQSAIAHLAGTTNNPPYSPQSPHSPRCPHSPHHPHHHHHHVPHSPPAAAPPDAIEMQPLPPSRPAPAIPTTAHDLQRFLDHELQRQEAVKRRIRNWLQGVAETSSHAHQHPQRRDALVPLPLLRHRTEMPTLMAVPPHRRKGSGESAKEGEKGKLGEGRRIPPDPERLREIEKEIEMYLGVPAPPMRLAHSDDSEPASESESSQEGEWIASGKEKRSQISRGSSSMRSEQEEPEDEDEEYEERELEEIDYSNLPPAIPRPGGRARAPVLSDPITVLHVGKPPAKSPLSTTPQRSPPKSPLPPKSRSPSPPIPPKTTIPPNSPTASNPLPSKPGLSRTLHPASKQPFNPPSAAAAASHATPHHTSEINDFAEKWLQGIRMSVDVVTHNSSTAFSSSASARSLRPPDEEENRGGDRDEVNTVIGIGNADRNDGEGEGEGEGDRGWKGKGKVVMRGGISSYLGVEEMGEGRCAVGWLKGLLLGGRGRGM